MLHTRHWRLLAVLTLAVTLVTLGLRLEGYAGGESPSERKVIRRPYLEGVFVALFAPAHVDPVTGEWIPDQAAFTFTGKCRGNNQATELGPIILDGFPASFFDPAHLDGAIIASDLLGAPPACFAKSGVITGYVVSRVRRFTVLRPNVVIADVEVSAVRP
jgi:hypothetical protein